MVKNTTFPPSTRVVRGLVTTVTLVIAMLVEASLPMLQPALVRAQSQRCEDIVCSKDAGEGEFTKCNKDKQACWEGKIREAQNSAQTLSSTIALITGQLRLKESQIEQTLSEIHTLEREIDDLTNRIAGLNLSLDRLTTVLVKRVNEQYKSHYVTPAISILASESFSQALRQYKYRTLAQQQTVQAMQQAETTKQTYDQEKALKEEKQAEVERKQAQLKQQQGELNKQKADQQFLLNETKNNEAMYQRELAKTLAELQAIQSIIAGKGAESNAGEVKQGDSIASIIVGASPCSTGTHLHFEVVQDGTHRDPAGYLKGIDAAWNNSPDTSFGFGGDWEWPVNNPAKINQGYGMTYYARVRRSYGGQPHTGIDMASKSSGDYSVKAVKDGTLFRGSIKCGGGQLRYVKVEHKDSNLSTYYLHVNY